MKNPTPSDRIGNIIERVQERRRMDALRFERIPRDECQLCKRFKRDLRPLIIDCFADLTEVIPEFIDTWHLPPPFSRRGYYLLICKGCRARLCQMLRQWKKISQRVEDDDD